MKANSLCASTTASQSLPLHLLLFLHIRLLRLRCASGLDLDCMENSEFSSLCLQVLTGIGICSFATDGDLDKHEDDAALEQVTLVPETVSSNKHSKTVGHSASRLLPAIGSRHTRACVRGEGRCEAMHRLPCAAVLRCGNTLSL